MKTIILMAVLSFSASNAMAQMIRVGKDDIKSISQIELGECSQETPGETQDMFTTRGKMLIITKQGYSFNLTHSASLFGKRDWACNNTAMSVNEALVRAAFDFTIINNGVITRGNIGNSSICTQQVADVLIDENLDATWLIHSLVVSCQ